ncbi:MAG: thiol-disulfide isomerase/thioredoxin [Hyphomicrobiaceae bacterium]|jgi:thiol-disulfide isomerase/thioredoxin
MNLSRICRTAAISVFAVLSMAASAQAGGDWNDKGIAWKTYEDGLVEAKQASKPVLLVIYTEWCPHCTRFSEIFHDTKVVEKSKEFVMIHVERDANKAISAKHAPDGEYIPRTYFLEPDGTLKDIHEDRPNYLYFYDTSSPDSLLRSMEKASPTIGNKPEAPKDPAPDAPEAG